MYPGLVSCYKKAGESNEVTREGNNSLDSGRVVLHDKKGRKEGRRRETSERRRTQSTFKVFFTIISLALESVGIRFYDCVIRDRERQLTG